MSFKCEVCGKTATMFETCIVENWDSGESKKTQHHYCDEHHGHGLKGMKMPESALTPIGEMGRARRQLAEFEEQFIDPEPRRKFRAMIEEGEAMTLNMLATEGMPVCEVCGRFGISICSGRVDGVHKTRRLCEDHVPHKRKLDDSKYPPLTPSRELEFLRKEIVMLDQIEMESALRNKLKTAFEQMIASNETAIQRTGDNA